jgi:pilus assembly protein CpaB
MRNNKKLIIAMTGAIIFGMVAVMLVTQYLANAQAYAKSLNDVVVAKMPIPIGTKITADLLTTASIPVGSMPEGAFNQVEKVAGRVAVIPIGLREPITDVKLAPEGVGGGLSAVIPEGYRAMTVKVDDVVGLSGFVMSGSFVDVVCVITPPSQQSGADPVSKIILQNIKVLASGVNLDRPKDEREASSVKAVTLQVTPEQAEKLALAVNEGKLQLVMRNYVDQNDAQTRGANKGTLHNGDSYVPPPAARVEEPKPAAPAQSAPVRRQPIRYVAPREEKAAPAPSPAPRRDTVELLEGTKRKNVEFP